VLHDLVQPNNQAGYDTANYFGPREARCGARLKASRNRNPLAAPPDEPSRKSATECAFFVPEIQPQRPKTNLQESQK
jgi:hypothetical protein